MLGLYCKFSLLSVCLEVREPEDVAFEFEEGVVSVGLDAALYRKFSLLKVFALLGEAVPSFLRLKLGLIFSVGLGTDPVGLDSAL